MAAPSSPAPDELKSAWRALVDKIKAGEEVGGERLYLLAAGPVPVEGAAGGALTLDQSGGIVLVVGLEAASVAAAEQVARQLQAVAGLPGAKLREAGVDPDAGGGLAARHAAFFGLDAPVELNSSQRCVAVFASAPGAEDVAAFAQSLGGGLSGTFVAAAEGLAPVATGPEPEIVLEPEAEPAPEPEAPEAETPEAEAPEAEAPEAEAPEAEAPEAPEAEAPEAEAPEAEAPEAAEAAEAEAPEADAPSDVAEAEAPEAEPEGPGEIEVALDATAEEAPDLVAPYVEDESTTIIVEETDAVAERTGISSWPIGNWIGLTMVVLGVVLAIIGVLNLNTGGGTSEDPPENPNPLIRTVASGVTPDATHARWIGQQRVVTLSDGTLVFAYPTAESLNLVKDGADGGETWQEPFVLEDVTPVSISVDVDAKDRLHVAFSDGASINYIRLKNKPAGWKAGRVIQLDDDTTSPVVDIAWDEQNQAAHVVWVQQSDDGEAPAWAALVNQGGIHLAEEGIGILAEPGRDVGVLVSVAADGRSSLLVTYRRGDQTEGWSSRYSAGRDDTGTWIFEEEEEIPVPAFVGAADVLYDRQKTAHLVVRDSTNFELVYFTKVENQPWSTGEVAHTGPDVNALDFPVLTYNAGEANLYVFFQTDEFDPAGEVSYVVRSLEGQGWQGPFDIMTAADAPEGAQYPAAPDRVELQTIVFWTKTGEAYEVDSAPVIAPDSASG